MLIEIMNRENAKRESFKKDRPLTAILSITDCDKEPVVFNSSNWIYVVIHLQFDDVEKGENCINENDAFVINDFVLNVKNKVRRIIVQCEAGVSRSAGVGAAIMKYLNKDDMEIFKNGKYCPNMACYRMVLNALMENDIKEKEKINKNAWWKEHCE